MPRKSSDSGVDLIGAGAGGVLGLVAHFHAVELDAGGAGEVNNVGLQSVQSHLSGLLTGDLSGAEHLLQTGIDAFGRPSYTWTYDKEEVCLKRRRTRWRGRTSG